MGIDFYADIRTALTFPFRGKAGMGGWFKYINKNNGLQRNTQIYHHQIAPLQLMR